MNDKLNGPPAPGINFYDVLYILFRHKWKIVGIVALSAVAAGLVYSAGPSPTSLKPGS